MTLTEEIAAYDKDQQRGWMMLSERGKAQPEIQQKLSNAFRGRFLRILSKYNDAPVFRIQCPAPHVAAAH